MDRTNGEGAGKDLPWASVFDPAANMRALSAIQADGFRAASELVDRFVRMASTGLADATTSTNPGTAPSDGQRADVFGATGLEPLVMSWWAMFDQFLRAGAARGDDAEPVRPPTLDFSTAQASGVLSLHGVPDSAAAAEVWLHNGGADDVGSVHLRCSDLLTHDGAVIPAQRVRFEPEAVPLPARSSRGVVVELAITEDTCGGTYRGTLLADGHPDIWLPVEVAVEPMLP